MYKIIFGSFDRTQVYSYLLLKENSDPKEVEAKINKVFEKHKGSSEYSSKGDVRLCLQPLADIHLQSNREYELSVNGSMNYIYAFSAIALVILFISSINFINLSTARSLKRAKEIGLRKVAGAAKRSLVFQLMGESFLTSFISMIFAVILAMLFLPLVNSILGADFQMSQFYNGYIIMGIVFVAFITGAEAGVYPAFFISSIPTILIIKGHLSTNLKGTRIREVLVTAQFVISIIMLICTFVVADQLDFLINKDLGFKKDQVVCFDINDTESAVESERIKNIIREHPDVLSVSTSLIVPGQNTPSAYFSLQGVNNEDRMLMDFTITDRNFVITYGMNIIKGMDFSEFNENDMNSFIINETAAEMFGGINNVLNKEITLFHPEFSRTGTVVGILQDFHFRTLCDEIGPFVITPFPYTSLLSVKIRPDKTSEVIKYVQVKLAELNQESVNNFFFIDEEFGRSYKTVEKLGTSFRLFAFMTVLVSCIGLIGLTSYTTGRRRKEIGIRKVLGASVTGIYLNLSKGFIKALLIANIIAFPTAFFIMEAWQQDFAYRTDFNLSIYLLAGLIAACFSLVSVSFYTYKAAAANPIDSIKYE